MVVRNPSSKFRFVFLLLLLLLLMMMMMVMMMMMLAFFWTTTENSLFKRMIKLILEPTKRAFTPMQQWSQSLIPIFFLSTEIFLTTKYNTCKRNCFVVCHRYNLCKSVARTSLLLKNLYFTLLYGCVSQGLATTEFTNLIGWTRYWPRSRFSGSRPITFCYEKIAHQSTKMLTIFFQKYLFMEVPKSLMRNK